MGSEMCIRDSDCFTIAEVVDTEDLGFFEKGKGIEAVREGKTKLNSEISINPSGGLKSKGHPIGATGVSMHALAAMQVLGEAGDMQVSGASVAGVFNMGGTGVANYCSIIEAMH